MGLFDRFFPKRKSVDFRPSEDTDRSETMYDKVGDPQIEGGVPDVQAASGTSKSPQQMVMLGAAVIGCGFVIAGLMMWINSAPAEEETAEKEVPEVSAESQYDMAADQARLLAEQQREAAASEEVASAETADAEEQTASAAADAATPVSETPAGEAAPRPVFPGVAGFPAMHVHRGTPPGPSRPRRQVASFISEGPQQQILLDVGQWLGLIIPGRKGDPGEDRPQDQPGSGMRIQVDGTLTARPSLIPDLLQVRASGGEELPEEQLLELRVLRQLSQKRQHRLTCGP